MVSRQSPRHTHQSHRGQVGEKRSPRKEGLLLIAQLGTLILLSCPRPRSLDQCGQDAVCTPKGLLCPDPLIHSVCGTRPPRLQGLRARPWPKLSVTLAPAPGCSWTSLMEGQLGQGHPGSCHPTTHPVPSGPRPWEPPTGLLRFTRKPTLVWYPEEFPQQHSITTWAKQFPGDLQAKCLLTNI